MTPDDFDRIEVLFDAATALPTERRASYLDEHCDDPAVRQQVESMLRADDLTMPELQTPAMGKRFVADGSLDEEVTVLPEKIGEYRVLRQLGRGGMGIVYEAEQEAPRRRVALKVIRPGCFSRQMRQRFEVEAHVLGQLHHPGIAQIYESGLADSGEGEQPYFAMELVEGESLRAFLHDETRPVRDRLAVMVQIADAVHHAHQKGVIHRDLKPDNVLIDSQGQPKVLDFGVARAIDSDMQVTTLNTNVGQIIGTLAYMSPEQVDGRPEELDTRSDVYSLGVMTYELLTGELPLDVTHQSVPSALRMIQEAEPRRLSEKNARLRGDLDTIVSKSLQKDKTHRYQSAADFAADIRRFLNDEPILARPASAAYQFRKFAKRNKALVGGTAAVFLSITIGLFVAMWFAVEASRQRWVAEAARDDAQRETQKLRAVNTFVAGMIAEANPANNPLPREMTVVDMLDVASARIPGMFVDAPEIESEIRATIGAAYRELGRFETARSHLTTALEMQQQIYGPDHLSIADVKYVLGGAHLDAGDREAARPLLEEALRIRRANLGDRHRDVADSLGALGRLYFLEGDYEPADRLLREALELGRELAPDDPLWLAGFHESLGTLAWQHGERHLAKDEFRASVDLMRHSGAESHPRYVQALNNLAVVLRWSGDLHTAEQLYRETLDKAQRIYGDEHPFIATTLNNIGWLLQSRGDLAEAEPLVRKAMEMRTHLLGPDHADVSTLMHNLAALLAEMGDLEQATPLMREALEVRRRALGPHHADLVPALHTLAELLERDGDLDGPEALLREAVEIDQRSYGESHPHVADSIQKLATLLHVRGEADQAETLLRRSISIRTESLGADHRDSLRTTLRLVEWLLARQQHNEAESLLHQIYERSASSDAGSHQRAAALLTHLYESLDRPEDAALWRQRATVSTSP